MIDLSVLLTLPVWLLGRYRPVRPRRYRPSLPKQPDVVQPKAFSLLNRCAELMLQHMFAGYATKTRSLAKNSIISSSPSLLTQSSILQRRSRLALVSLLSICISASLMLSSAHGYTSRRHPVRHPPLLLGGLCARSGCFSSLHFFLFTIWCCRATEDLLIELKKFFGQFLGQVTSC